MREPVAWQISDGTIINGLKGVKPQDDWIPLYTHPVKQLSDKEILALWDWDSGEILATDLLDFADAIIKEITE